MKRHIPALFVLFCAVIVATWPLASVLGTAAIGHPYGDMPDHYWGTWWFGKELLSGTIPLHTDLSHYPETLSLWYIDPIGALLALPLRVFGFPAAWNLLLLIQVSATALAGYFIGHDVSGQRSSGVVAGVVAGLSPYMLGLLHSGLAECISLAPVTLYVWLLLRASGLDPRGRPAPKHAGAWSAVLLALSGAASLYYFLFGLIFAGAAIPGPGWRERGRALLPIAIGGSVLAAPVALLTLSTLGDGGAVTTANAPGWISRLPATDILTFIRPGTYYFPDTPAGGNPGILHINYLGWAALGLAGLGIWRAASRWRLTTPGAVYGVFMLGPRLAFAQHLVMIAGTSVLLPLGLFCFPGSPLGFVHQPYRMVAFFMPWLAIAAALGASHLRATLRPALVVCVLAETLFVSPAHWPLVNRVMTPPATHLALSAGPVLDWPPDGSTANRDYLMWATQHGQPVPYGVNVFLSEKLRRDPLINAMLRLLRRLDMRSRNRDVPFQGRLLLTPTGTETQLAAMGFVHVIVHKESLDNREWTGTESLLHEAFGAPIEEDTKDAVWAVR